MKRPIKDNQQYFSIATATLRAFSKNQTSALAVCTFIVFARYSMISSGGTAASVNILCDKLRIGRGKANKAINELLECKYQNGHSVLSKHIVNCDISDVCDSEEKREEFNASIQFSHKRKHKSLKYIFNFRGDDILIANALVDGKCEELRALIRRKDQNACYLLLTMHGLYDYQFDTVRPDMIYIEDVECEGIYSENGVGFWYAKLGKSPIISVHVHNNINSNGTLTNADIGKILATLENIGLVKKVIYAYSHKPQSDSSHTLFYELDIKTNDPSEKALCHDLAYRVRKKIQDKGYTIGRKDNRFFDEYVFIAPSDHGAEIRTLYRLPYAIRNMWSQAVKNGMMLRQQKYDEINNLLNNV